MASIVNISAQRPQLTAAPGEQARLIFTVVNTSGRRLHIGAQPLADPHYQDWVCVEGRGEARLMPDAETTLELVVQVPDATPPGEIKPQLLVFDLDQPGEHFDEGEPVRVRISARARAPVPMKPRRRSWPVTSAVFVAGWASMAAAFVLLLQDDPTGQIIAAMLCLLPAALIALSARLARPWWLIAAAWVALPGPGLLAFHHLAWLLLYLPIFIGGGYLWHRLRAPMIETN
jgi:hypothetical protein